MPHSHYSLVMLLALIIAVVRDIGCFSYNREYIVYLLPTLLAVHMCYSGTICSITL